jgi:hypothetical protein
MSGGRNFPLRAGVRRLTASWAEGLFVLLLLAGCNPKPVAFSLGQAIPMGSWVFTISDAESVSPSTFRGLPYAEQANGKQVLVVHLNVQGVERSDLGRLQLTLMGFRVVDRGGKRYGPPTPFPAKLWNMMQSLNVGMMPRDLESQMSLDPVPEDWVVLFMIPEEASDLSLHMSNPRPHDKQPEAALVPLGR